MTFGSLVYFFVTSICLGFLIDLFVPKWKADFLEKIVMRFGVGVAAWSVLGVILNLLHIPLHWAVYLVVAIAVAGLALWKNPEVFNIGMGKEIFFKQRWFFYSILAIVLFSHAGMMYMSGSFGYDYFEDGDPWVYSAVTKNIAEDLTFTADYKYLHYVEPYTQGYQLVLAAIAQTNQSLYWTMKFFTTLFLGFSILFFYFFARRFTENEDHAILATVFLWAMPAWLGHFIYSLNWNMVIFVILLYPLVLTASDKPKKWYKGWRWVLAILFASLWINHFYTAMAGTLLIILYYLVRVLSDSDLHEGLLQGMVGGLLISLLFFIPAYARHWQLIQPGALGFGGAEELFPVLLFLTSGVGLVVLIVGLGLLGLAYYERKKIFEPAKKFLKSNKRKMTLYLSILALILIILILPVKLFESFGSGSRVYTLTDFFIATSQNLINNPISIGWVIMGLFCVGIILAALNIAKLFSSKNANVLAMVTWAVATLLIVNSMRFSITFVPFRMWTFFAIFCALLAAFPVAKILQSVKNMWVSLAVVAILLVAVIPTSHAAKVAYNSQIWPDQEIIIPESQQLFSWMKNGGVPKNSRVMRLCSTSYPMAGYDMSAQLAKDRDINPGPGDGLPYWTVALEDTLEGNLAFMRSKNIEYVTIGSSCLTKGTVDERQKMAGLINPRLQEMINSTNFIVINVSQSPPGTDPGRQAVEVLFRII